MLFKSLVTCALAATSGLISAVGAADLPEIEIVGNKFFYSNNGSQFLIRGIAYQQNTNETDSTDSFTDPLADADACRRDIPYLEAVGTNVIRVYALNVSLDHTECMDMLSDAGIYVIADLSEPSSSIDRSDPRWDVDLFDRYARVVDLFHNYTNVLGFFAGNEVTNERSNTNASAFVKAAIRDTKAYIREQDYRTIPVGYSANDDSAIRIALAQYFACGDEEESADFFGMNNYEWCGDSSFRSSGYSSLTTEYRNLGIPLFFSEYGCNEVSPRRFTEVRSIFSDDMTEVWSGGIVYMYFQEANDYGLVSVDGDSVSTLRDYSYYSSEIARISPSLASSAEAASTSRTSCPTRTSVWEASTDLPPTPNEGLCNCMERSLSCVVSDDVSSEDYGDLFGTVCGEIDCGGIAADASSGEYGAYSPCNSRQQLNFLLNLYYEDQDRRSDACDFDGSATTRDGTTASSCSSYLRAAGTSGLGSVSGVIESTRHTATGTARGGDSGDSSSSGGSSSGTGSSRSSGAGKSASIDITTVFVAGVSMVFGFGLIFA